MKESQICIVITDICNRDELLHSFRCSVDGVDDKRIISMQIDSRSHSLFVAFTSCVVKVPLSRCERHGKCKKWVELSSHNKVISCNNNRVLSLRKEVKWELYEVREHVIELTNPGWRQQNRAVVPSSLTGPVLPPGILTAAGCLKARAWKSQAQSMLF